MAAPGALLFRLNPDQRAAATHADGPVQVIAGAGTGKTRVLVARIAWLIATGRARPEDTCALAFMNDAASQIRRRLASALGEAVARRVWVGTSHRLAARVLAARPHASGAQSASRSGTSTTSMLRSPRSPPRHRARTPARARTERLEPPYGGGAGEGDSALRDALAAYERAKRVSSAFDFDDLLRYAVIALESDNALRAAVGGRFTHVLVDEFQDLNAAQYRLVALIAGVHRRLTGSATRARRFAATAARRARRTSAPWPPTSPTPTA